MKFTDVLYISIATNTQNMCEFDEKNMIISPAEIV